MDAKAVMKARMREASQKRRKRIESPLVRYNELEQPVCKVCEVTIKSEALWTAHIASRQHKAAVDELKARAAAASGRKSSEPPKETEDTVLVGTRHSSTLPDDFFDAPEPKRQMSGSQTKTSKPSAVQKPNNARFNSAPAIESSPAVKSSTQTVTQDGKQIPAAEGSLPEGFFDNQDADSRARGLAPVKLDIQDEYKEFQKSIKEDVKDVDVRLEEEEFEAAEEREEREQIEQRNIVDRIEFFKKRQQEKAVAAAKVKAIQSRLAEMDNEELSDESDEEDNLFVDWRAKHI